MGLDNYEKPLIHLIRHIGKLLKDNVGSTIREREIHLGQARILEALLRNDNLNQGTIGRELRIKPATVTNQVKRMEASGLITRRKDPKDDRFMNVTLTPKGREAAIYMMDVLGNAEEEIRSVFSKKEVDSLREHLEKIRNKLGGDDPGL